MTDWVWSGSRFARVTRFIEVFAAWLLAVLWIAPILFAVWAAFRPRLEAAAFDLAGPWILDNFATVWNAAPFGRYYMNTVLMVSMVLSFQLALGILAAYAFARFEFRGRELLFAMVLLQLMIFPEMLLSENYRTVLNLGLLDSIVGIGIPYFASAFCIFLLRQQFKSVPIELDEAAQMEGASRLRILAGIYVPLVRPTIIAFGLVSVSHHWNNFLWPLVVTSSVESRVLTVGLALFNTTETGFNWSIIAAAAVIVIAPLLAIFIVFQRQFVESFMRVGIR